MPRETPKNYQIGYGKPPRQSRFVKGQSGNPQGRPRGSKNLATLISEALNERVTVVENGRRRKITKREAIVAQLVNRSAAADLRAIKLLFDIQQAIEARSGPEAPRVSSPADIAQSDRAIIARYLKKLSRGGSDAK